MNPEYMGQPVPVPSKMPPVRRGLSGRMLVIIGLLLAAVLAGIGLTIANQDKSGPLSQRLTYRLDALEDILKDGKKNASSDKLRKITGEASLLLTGDITALETVLPETKGKKPAAVAEAEDSKPSLERLKTAKVNGTYDSAYTSELTTKLEATTALTRELHGKTRSKKVREALNTMHQHLAQVEKDLAAD